MATTRLMPLHTGKGRTVGQAISAIIDYTENPQKTDGGRLITSWQCDSRIADAEFLFTKNQYIQKTGRVRGEDDVIAYHLRQSFVPGEITPEDANRLGCELAKRFTKGNHAYIVCTHIDKVHIHNHVIWNPVLADYYLEILGLMFLILAAYRLSGFAVQAGRPRIFSFYAEVTAVLALSMLADGAAPSALLTLGGALALTAFQQMLRPGGEEASKEE